MSPTTAITALIAVLFFTFGLVLAARGDEPMKHDHEALGIEGQFFKTWFIPPSRETSCCDDKDCYTTQVRKTSEGGWEYLHRETKTWEPIPEGKLEHNQKDARDSPTGLSYVCAHAETKYVYCAVLGAGT